MSKSYATPPAFRQDGDLTEHLKEIREAARTKIGAEHFGDPTPILREEPVAKWHPGEESWR